MCKPEGQRVIRKDCGPTLKDWGSGSTVLRVKEVTSQTNYPVRVWDCPFL